MKGWIENCWDFLAAEAKNYYKVLFTFYSCKQTVFKLQKVTWSRVILKMKLANGLIVNLFRILFPIFKRKWKKKKNQVKPCILNFKSIYFFCVTPTAEELVYLQTISCAALRNTPIDTKAWNVVFSNIYSIIFDIYCRMAHLLSHLLLQSTTKSSILSTNLYIYWSLYWSYGLCGLK